MTGLRTEGENGMNDTAVITGGSRGIGLAISKELASAGFRLAIIYAGRKEAAVQAAESLRAGGTDTQIYACDVADTAGVKAVSEAILDRFGRVDVLVNNAGIAQIRMFTDTTEEDWDRMMDVNVKGLYNTCSAFLPQMISRKKGRIINLSSMWGISGASCEVAYSASKAAVIGFTKALAREVGPSGITVNCVAPGVIDTEMNAGLDEETREELRSEIPLDRIGNPSDVAGMVSFLASEKASYITGQIIGIDGGIL